MERDALQTELKIMAGLIYGMMDSDDPTHQAACLQWQKIEADVMDMADKK